MAAPSIAANDSTTGGLWVFDRSSVWTARYGNCSNKATRTSPLNIDTTSVSPCNVLCRFALKYEPTTCSVSMINNIPTVRFSPNCLAKFKNEFFYLSKMTIHHTSMHTINDSYCDLELLLYHNRNPINDSDGGIIVSVLLKKGNDYGIANEFLNEFINQMPISDAKDLRRFSYKCEPKIDLQKVIQAPSGEKVMIDITFGVEFFRPFISV